MNGRYILDDSGEPRPAGLDEWARWMETSDWLAPTAPAFKGNASKL